MIGLDTTFLVAAVHEEHPGHAEATNLLREWLDRGEQIRLCSHVIAEFLHIVTDGRRFEAPMSMTDAIDKAENWLEEESCRCVETTDAVLMTAMSWMVDHRLGRKRILDTLIAATYAAADVEHLATLNAADFRIFDLFDFLPRTDP